MDFRWMPRRVEEGRGVARKAAAATLFLGSLATLAGVAATVAPRRSATPRVTAAVRRADFNSVVVAAGVAESISSTEIRSTLERLNTGSVPTILALVPDGANVKKGEVLCEIDAAGYKELVRQQNIRVQQARASHLQGQLDLEVTKIARDAYVQGQLRETDRQFRGQIALLKSDLERQLDRLAWTNRMFTKGYASTLQVVTEEQTRLKAQLTLKQAETSFANFERFTAPKALRSLESQINAAQASLDFQTIRLNREEERLGHYKKMVDACTVRAPHDGMAIHAEPNGRDGAVELGAQVRQRQKLFQLPDLSRMEVHALLHETVVNRIRPGMPARVRVEALPEKEFTGVVSSVAPLPMNERRRETGSDVTYFLAKVRLDDNEAGLRPGMSSEVEIVTDARRGVLAIPHTALTQGSTGTVCHLVRDDHLEQRTVSVGAACHDLVEVVGGLDEGDVVVVDDGTGDEPAL